MFTSSGGGGGAPIKIPSLIIYHFDKTLANGFKSMPIYEVYIPDVKSANIGLPCRICEQMGLIQALQIKFHRWIK